jgi:hypothetical protein
MSSFSERNQLSKPEVPITIFNDASIELREAIYTFFTQLDPGCHDWYSSYSEISNKIHEKFDLANDKGYFYIDLHNKDTFEALKAMLSECLWHAVYDIAEYIYVCFRELDLSVEFPEESNRAEDFQKKLNKFLSRNGHNFIMHDGKIELRESYEFHANKQEIDKDLNKIGAKRAAQELKDAWREISRRPDPNTTAAVRHAVAALECLGNHLLNTTGETLGKIIKKLPFRAPLDKVAPNLYEVADKLWGFSSRHARHSFEGKEPTLREAKFAFSVAQTLIHCMLLDFQNADEETNTPPPKI